MNEAAVLGPLAVALVVVFAMVLPSLRNRLDDQIKCRLTLDFEPYLSATVHVPVEREPEFVSQMRRYSGAMAMMYGDYRIEPDYVGNEEGFLVIQSCNRHFNYHIENIYEPARFRLHSMRSRRLTDREANRYFDSLIRRLEAHFEVTDITSAGGGPPA